jgi:hypothetical protein
MDAFPLEFFDFITDVQPFKINPTDNRGKIINTKDVKVKIIQEILNTKNHYQNVKINGIMFIMENFTGQKYGLILKGWTSVIKSKNSKYHYFHFLRNLSSLGILFLILEYSEIQFLLSISLEYNKSQ